MPFAVVEDALAHERPKDAASRRPSPTGIKESGKATFPWEGAVLVRIHAEHGGRQRRCHLVERLDNQHLLAHAHGDAFGPAAGNVGQREGVDKVPVGLRAATVLDPVDLEKYRWRIAPIGEGAHRDAASDGRPYALAALALPVDVQPRSSQYAVDGRRADLQDPGLDDRAQIEMAVPHHGIDQHRDQRLQALAADPISRFPQHAQCLANRLVVDAVTGARRLRSGDLLAQHPDRVLAVIAGQGHELIEDLDPVTERRAAIPLPQRLDQLLACRHADLPHHVVPLPPDNPTGSKLREATGQRR